MPESRDGAYRNRRVLVVGASSGIGRSLALEVARRGARVALGARRLDLIEEVAAEILATGGDARAWRCDVTDESNCRRVVGEAAEWMGGIDTVFYMAGSSPLVRIAEADADQWDSILRVNLVGASITASRALPYLRQSTDPVFVVTTHSMGVPWPWLGVYASAKAAVSELARALRSEEPWLRSLCVSVGNTATPFADSWDAETFSRAMEQWLAEGRMRHEVMQADQMASVLLDVAIDPSAPDEIVIQGKAFSD